MSAKVWGCPITSRYARGKPVRRARRTGSVRIRSPTAPARMTKRRSNSICVWLGSSFFIGSGPDATFSYRLLVLQNMPPDRPSMPFTFHVSRFTGYGFSSLEIPPKQKLVVCLPQNDSNVAPIPHPVKGKPRCMGCFTLSLAMPPSLIPRAPSKLHQEST